MREITLSPTKSSHGRAEHNEPVRVYDCSGPWGDPGFTGNVEQGLPRLRHEWIRARGDVEEYAVPQNNGDQTRSAAGLNGSLALPQSEAPRPLRAAKGHPVTQLWYARQGIITPEMEFIAIRENQGLELLKSELSPLNPRNNLLHQHPGMN